MIEEVEEIMDEEELDKDLQMQKTLDDTFSRYSKEYLQSSAGVTTPFSNLFYWYYSKLKVEIQEDGKVIFTGKGEDHNNVDLYLKGEIPSHIYDRHTIRILYRYLKNNYSFKNVVLSNIGYTLTAIGKEYVD